MFTALHRDLLSDTLYGVNGAAIVAVNAGAGDSGVWRSGIVRVPGGIPTGFAWARLQGVFVDGAVLKLYADGVLVYTTPTIMNSDPVRLPDLMARSWEIELSSKDRITSLVVTDDTEALL